MISARHSAVIRRLIVISVPFSCRKPERQRAVIAAGTLLGMPEFEVRITEMTRTIEVPAGPNDPTPQHRIQAWRGEACRRASRDGQDVGAMGSGVRPGQPAYGRLQGRSYAARAAPGCPNPSLQPSLLDA